MYIFIDMSKFSSTIEKDYYSKFMYINAGFNFIIIIAP